jgi:hypothetical protein
MPGPSARRPQPHTYAANPSSRHHLTGVVLLESFNAGFKLATLNAVSHEFSFGTLRTRNYNPLSYLCPN